MKKYYFSVKYILVVLIFLGGFSIPVFSQNGWNLNWMKSISMRGDDDPRKIKTDSLKNVYLSAYNILGVSGVLSDSVDLDHGPGDYWVRNQNDYFVKYDSSGTFKWAWSCKRGNSGGSDIRFDVSENGDVFLAFSFTDSLDIDPGVSTNYIYTSSAGRRDVAALKFNNNGILQWVETLGGSSDDFVNSIAFDGDQSIYLIGSFGNTVDFDPGVGIFNVSSQSGNSQDVYLLRLTTSGSFVWVRTFGSITYPDFADFVTIYNHSIVTLSGKFYDTCDFDAGSDSFNLSSINPPSSDGFLCQYDSAGSFRWAKNTIAWNSQFAQDASGNIFASCRYYISPNNFTFANNKFSLNGDSLLSCDLRYLYDGVSDGKDGVYFSWRLYGTYDFDPGAGVFNLSSTNNAPVIVKLDTSYNFIYAKIIAENGSSGISDFSITADDGIYCVGTYNDTTDFNTSGGVNNAFPATNGFDTFLLKLTRPSLTPAQITDTLLACDSIMVYGLNVSYDTSFTQILPSFDNCDSIINVNVEIENTFSPSICLVSVDSASSHNVIIFEKPTGLTSVDSFYIYRETGTNTYQIIGVLSDTSLTVFDDYAANPSSTSFKYKIASLNGCGVVSVPSAYHSTIHLQHLGNGNFQWTNYLIENVSNPVLSYNFFRDNFSTGNFQLIQVIPGNNTTFTDINFSSYPDASYRVEVNWFSPVNCNPTSRVVSSFNTSRSNILAFGVTGISDIKQFQIFVSPNPAIESFNLDFGSMYSSLLGGKINISNIIGCCVYSANIEKERQIISRSSFDSPGLYLISVTDPNGAEVLRKKIVLE